MINMLFNGVPVNIMALAGLVFAFIMTCLLLVKCNDRLPKDQGREFAVNGALSAGKPRGAGFIFILVFIVSVVLFCELNTEIIIYLVLLAAAMMTGFLDDCSRAPWADPGNPLFFSASRWALSLADLQAQCYRSSRTAHLPAYPGHDVPYHS